MTDLDPTPPRGLPIDPRFRRRWAEARRQEGRRRLRILVSTASFLAILAGGLALLHSPLLTVREVRVVGDTHTPRAELLAAAGLVPGRSLMLDVGGGATAGALRALPWVGTVRIERHWPWSVVLNVQERKAVALVRTRARGLDVVDASGRVLEAVAPGGHGPALPLIDGALGAPPGTAVAPAHGTTSNQLRALLAAAAATPAGLAHEHPVLAPAAGGALMVYVRHSTVLLGSPVGSGYKLAVLGELAQSIDLSSYSEVDLRVPGHPALTPLGSAGKS